MTRILAIALAVSLTAPARLFAGLERARAMAQPWPGAESSDFSSEALSDTAARPWLAAGNRRRHDNLAPAPPQKQEIEIITRHEDRPAGPPWKRKQFKTVGLAMLVGAGIGGGAGGAAGAGFGAVFGMLFGIFWVLFSRLK